MHTPARVSRVFRPHGIALAVTLLCLLVVPLMIYTWLEGRAAAPKRDTP